MAHVYDPLRLAGEREDIVDRHDTEVDGHDGTIDDVRHRGTADLKWRRLATVRRGIEIITEVFGPSVRSCFVTNEAKEFYSRRNSCVLTEILVRE